MARLARLRDRAGVTQAAIAAHLGVHRCTIYVWDIGSHSPHYQHAVAYAHQLDQHIVLRHDRHILATDGDIPVALPELRKAAGLTPRQYGDRLHIIEAAARGLDPVIDLRSCQPLRIGVAL
ncbi:helix-turn-helix domain-containing protein [Nonomuraea zeae]|uniref:Helix-turn-helix transcriptional regulator n=1 Tax=Nonomuraea zeae TaxID=1642303 RepID=A0A5S4H3A7_9ACTN|nr:helix-turn-helix transcriptional regulator [Nonomuraea zeae]TMR39617.1 helix-turn-helix transcriptional regulator [Nonomuraea zeae]